MSAAVRSLHGVLERLAKSETAQKGKDKSPIRPEDVSFVCNRDVGQGAKLLLFHALVAHWKAVEVAQIREDSVWAKVCDEHSEFEKVVMGSKEMEDGVRGMYLASVEMYLDEVREKEREKERLKDEERKRGLVREVVLGRLRGGVGVGGWGRSARGSRFGSGRGTVIGGGSGSGSANGGEGESQAVPSGLSENDWMVVDAEGDEEI